MGFNATARTENFNFRMQANKIMINKILKIFLALRDIIINYEF